MTSLPIATWSSYRIVPPLCLLPAESLPPNAPLYSGSMRYVSNVRDEPCPPLHLLHFPPSGVFFSFGMYQAAPQASAVARHEAKYWKEARGKGKSFMLHSDWSTSNSVKVYTEASACCFDGTVWLFTSRKKGLEDIVTQQMFEWAHTLNGFVVWESAASRSVVAEASKQGWKEITILGAHS